MELILDKEACVGCGVCSRACPKEAISKKKLNEPIRFSSKQIIKKVRHFLIPNVRDPSACVYCGTCAYLCPFEALTLSINGEPIPLDKLQLVEKHALPKLEYELKTLDSGKKAKVYTEGSVSIKTELCAGGCKNCAESCPSGAITWSSEEKEISWDSEIVLTINNDKCISCGACDNACPTGALTLEITKVRYSGEYNSPFWDNIVSRLKLKERV